MLDRPHVLLLIASLFALDFCQTRRVAAEGVSPQLSTVFSEKILSVLETHCLDCHDASTREAELDLSSFKQFSDVTQHYQIWEIILERVEAGEMPPADASPAMEDADRALLIQWIHQVRNAEAQRNAGDPGAVLARRLSNAEYDYSIRDLTGVDIRPTRTFPVDPANEAGFDNSGESLSMSPALLNKYLEAARAVTEHLVLAPSGIRFAPHPVVTDTDRDKYCVKRIVEFYQQQPTDYGDYFYAAWLGKILGQQQAEKLDLHQIATRQGISSKYLSVVWDGLHDQKVHFGPMAHVQTLWNQLPVSATDDQAVRTRCNEIGDYIRDTRKYFEFKFENLDVPEIHNGAQAFVLWKNKRYAQHRRQANFSLVQLLTSKKAEQTSLLHLRPPSEESHDQYLDDCRKFCDAFPDAFYISERGRDYLDTPKEKQEKGRLLSAGFHSMMGYFRDDQPLYDLVLNEDQQAELDQLWRELDFVASAPMRQYQGFLWFERTDSGFMRDPEFDFARPEDLAALKQPVIRELAKVYRAKAIRNGAKGDSLQAIDDYFEEINSQIRWVEQTRQESQQRQFSGVMEFAGRAFRRPLREAEQVGLQEFYLKLREDDGLSHAEAIEDLLVAVLMSPNFCYRVDLLADSSESRPLDNFELASRLSYFLWSSVPDEELLQLAAEGRVTDPEILRQQTRRLLKSPKIRALAVEFGGNWLDFRRFEEHNSVDRDRFPAFDDDLRRSMFEEPIRFFVDVIQQDGSLLDFLYGDYTFVNGPLAKHYGIDDVEIYDDSWRRVEGVRKVGRGGVLAMSVFLTKNAPGLRTSPVKRGYWVVRRLLGQRIPAPPPNVPELPSDESQLGEKTLRETLAIHRKHASCSGCHNKIDSIGLVFESFGPVGERREVDLGGRSIDDQAVFPDGTTGQGVEDLRRYITNHREKDFVENVCRKLLSYALGRSLILSDEVLLQQMQAALVENDYRFSVLVDTIVPSPQFLSKRARSE